MRAAIAALALTLNLGACATARPVNGEATPIGTGLEMRLPATPGYPGHFSATQTVIGNYGGQRGAFQAVLDFSPDKANVVITAVSGPRILGLTWTAKGIIEDRTPLAPENLKGINILGDIFVALWPLESVQHAMPEGVFVVVDGNIRRVKTSDRVIEEVETKASSGAAIRQEVRNLDFGYQVTIITEKAG
jgi:Protein of unknown function (DUF3261)